MHACRPRPRICTLRCQAELFGVHVASQRCLLSGVVAAAAAGLHQPAPCMQAPPARLHCALLSRAVSECMGPAKDACCWG
jgi:hypothetical protein